MNLLRSSIASLALLLAFALPARAHEIRPAYLEVTEAVDGSVDVLWKLPTVGRLSIPIRPQLSAGWLERDPDRTSQTDQYLISNWHVAAPHEALAGQQLRIDGLDRTITDVLTRVQYANGVTQTRLLKPESPSLTLPQAEKPALPILEYLTLGFTHIWEGVDHLLYVFGLLLLVGNFSTLLKTITAFTVAHSLTLAAAALNLITVKPAPVEAVIALSIVYVAVELVELRRGRAGLAKRYPWLVAFTFGLLHGLGFAGALAQVGLPQGDIPLALLLFNLGIELGQISFVAIVLGIGAALRWAAPRLTPRLAGVPPYVIGSVASYWFIERTLAFL